MSGAKRSIATIEVNCAIVNGEQEFACDGRFSGHFHFLFPYSLSLVARKFAQQLRHLVVKRCGFWTRSITRRLFVQRHFQLLEQRVVEIILLPCGREGRLLWLRRRRMAAVVRQR